ncbi:MAG: hypothetical protein AAGC57_18355 [Pseudomonadota bacterium]
MKAQHLRRRLPTAEAALRIHPDVTMVGIGETEAGAYAFVVGMEPRADPGRPLPPRLIVDDLSVPVLTRPCPADSLRTGDGSDGGNTALDGSDLLIAGVVGRTGTLGLVVAEAGGLGRLFGLTNAHVVTEPDRDATGDPIKAHVNGADRNIGTVAYQAPYNTGGGNTIDMALIALNAEGRRLARQHRIQTFPGETVVGSGGLSFSRFAGARRPHRYGGSTLDSRDVVPLANPVEHAAIDLTDRSGARIRFGRAFTIDAGDGGVRGGHSGALVVRTSTSGGMIAAGLLAGGRGAVAVAFSFRDVLAELDRSGIGLV